MAHPPPANSPLKMVNWSSFPNLWLHHKREIRYYGICLLGAIISIGRHNWKLLVGFVLAMLALWTYDRWGKRWQERGQDMLGRKNP